MSTREHPDDSAKDMSSSLPPLKWSEEIFDGLVQNLKFPKSWGVMYLEEGQTTTKAPAVYITLFWDYFTDGNFQLPVIRFVLDILGYYKFHISQLNPMGMVQIRHFEFLCRSMHIEPTGFYSFAQRLSAKKILLSPPKSFHEWKPKFFYIKAGGIPMKMTFRGAEDIEVETLKTLAAEIWYQDMKDVPSIELPERALVAAGMSLHWKADRHDKPVYVEDDKSQFTNLGVGPESKKKKRAPTATVVPKKFDTLKADVLKEGKKKGTHPVSGPWCDYIVVSDTLGLSPIAVRKPKPEPRDTTDNPVSNPDDPIDLESSPEPLLRTKAMKRKQPEGEVAAQPAKKITRKRISMKGNLDALAAKLSLERPVSSARAEPSSVINDDVPSSPTHVSIREQLEGTKTAEAEMEKAVEVEKPVEAELEAEKTVEAETADIGATKPKSPEVMAHRPERGKSILKKRIL
ncbi:hypothetical protein HanHA300_Chr00c0019g0682991 [Helianthus annuus]|nr:hypothetical protein HanIR_Chr03g0101261 [Helianthus annuus]KAJ0638902.1 hypothetical protein HanHA300_Chr00c0019g0682991 [Helianthus annuus]KAJ0772702.1 hypothetical protein HanOQP8_Chr03g0090421 [Helianthus annuus]KAJ0942208.1 hypothetical protein HanPSC8_Chr03g0089231 [Helianthus annuus]